MSKVDCLDVVIAYRSVGVVAYSAYAALLAAQKKYEDHRVDSVQPSKTGKIDAIVSRELLVDFC